MSEQPKYAIDLNERIKTFDCPDCGKKSMTVWGFVSRNNAAHAVYYAGLMTGHDQVSVRLTISIGGWGAENVDELRQSLERTPADSIVLELGDLILADREAAKFLGESEACGRIVLRNCPAYIRQWIADEDSR